MIGKDKFTKNQFLSLKKLIIKWKKKYPDAEILGHSNFNNTRKTCPNFDVKSWLKKTGIVKWIKGLLHLLLRCIKNMIIVQI